MGKLAKALGALEKDEKKGAPPSKDDLKQLQAAVTALSGYLATLQAGTAANPAGSTAAPAGDGSTAAVSGLSGLLGSPAGSAADPTQGGTSAADGNPDGAAGSSGDTSLGQLADKIEALSSALAQTQPGLASDLDQLAKVLEPGMGGATASPAGTAAITAAMPGASTSATGKDAATGSSAVNAQLAQSAGVPGANGAQIKGSHSSKPESDKSTDHAADKAASTDKATSTDKTDTTTISATADATDNPSNGGASGTSATQAGAQTAVALAPPQVPAGGGTAVAQQAQAAYQPVDTAAVNLPQMAFEIARHVDHGSSEFQIRLDPADLGRVDVKLAVDPTGAISAHLSAERPETLDLLRRDAGALNQALTQAGLDGSKTNLQFSLSQNPFTRQDNNPQPTPQTGGTGDSSETAPVGLAPAISLYRGHMTSSGLNIFV